MLNAVIGFSLRYRPLIVALSLGVLVYGSYVISTLPIDVFPDLDRPRVVLLTEAPGMAPEEVETRISFPLESAVLGATGVQAVRSQSAVGLSVVYIEFDWGTDVHVARQTVQERLSAVMGSLPADVKPQMAPISSLMGTIMHVGLYRQKGPGGGELAPIGKTGLLAEWREGKEGAAQVAVWDLKGQRLFGEGPGAWKRVAAAVDLDGRRATLTIAGQEHEVVFPAPLEQQLNLRTLADWVIRPRLMKIPGVAQVSVMGAGRKQYQVLVNPEALLTYDVTLAEVVEVLRKNNLNASGGYAIQGESERPIRIIGRLGPEPQRVLRELAEVPVKATQPRPIPLSQLARVEQGAQLKRGDANVNGQAAVVLTVTKQPHTDTRRLTDDIESALADLAPSLPADVVIHTDLFKMKGFIDRGIFNVVEALAIGAGLVLVILFLFLLNFRTTFISLTAIPLSLVTTGLVFKFIGWLTGTQLSINVMTLGGIAVAMGELVDDAIVDVENIFRRLRENHTLPLCPPQGAEEGVRYQRPALQVIYDASVEVRSAIVFGTLMVILVFLPLFALSGMEGRLFTPLGVAYIVSILASLLVSLTVTPVLSSYLLPQARATHRQEDSPLLRFLKKVAARLIRLSMARAGTILLVAWLLVAVCVGILTQLGADFLPPFDEGSVQVNIALPAGSSLEASNQVCAAVDRKLEAMRAGPNHPQGEILNFVRRTGRAEQDEHADPVNFSEYILTTNPASGRSRRQVLDQILAELHEDVPGVDIEVEQPLAHLISHMLSGVTAQIAIKVFGDDLEMLRQTAERIQAALQDVDGITPPVIEAQQLSAELHLRLRPDQLAFYGVHRADVAHFLSTALQGEPVSEVLEGQRRFDLIVRLDEPYRSDYLHLSRLRMALPQGGSVPLGELVQIDDGLGPNLIQRENARRRLVIRCNTSGRDLAGAVAAIRQRIDQRVRPTLPEGYFIEYGGQFESQRRATLVIAILAGVAFAGMYLVLYLLYPSNRIVLQILNALPAAFIGGVLALLVTGQTLTVASMVGFISLGGIAARNGILLVSHYFHLMKYEGEGLTPAMVLRGSLERLSPVLMTALTAGIGLVPLVVGGHQPGREILYPVATVILGGLITSTLCEFLIHPGIFFRFCREREVRRILQRYAE
jgi:HME family heavy-metal exporter